MIKQKLKKCIGCGKESRIFSKKLCRTCFFKQNAPKPLKKSPIKPSTKPIKKVSEVGKERNKIYRALRKQYLLEHPLCEVCGIRKSTEIHHRKKRSGQNMFMHFLAVCHEDHLHIEANPAWALEMGYSISQHKKEE